MMKTRVLLLTLISLIACFSHAQTRNNSPEVRIEDEPMGILEDGVTGWVYSKDGKWMNGESRIYPRIKSENAKILNDGPYEVGIDNFSSLVTHRVQYGKDTLILLIKFFESGYFKYPSTQSGWKKQMSAHYFVVENPDDKLVKGDTALHTKRIRMLDAGTIEEISKRKYLDQIMANLNLMKPTNRYMHFDYQFWPESCTIRFMLYGNHAVFHDLTGTVSDLTIKGASLFGTSQLLNYVYFEVNFDTFSELKLF